LPTTSRRSTGSCTSVARTLLDLAAVVPRRAVERVLAGYRVVRFPSKQVFDEPSSVEATLRGLLRQAA
jgi:hypothetical protein